MSDTSTNKFVGRGTTAQRLAFVPNPGTPTPTPAQGYTFWDTDTQRLYAYDFGLAAWVATSSGTAGTVTNTGTLTSNRLLKGNGGVDVTVGDLTGDVTTAGTMATTIANSAVTLAKIANAAANSKLVGSGAAGSGAAYSELTLGTGLTMSGTTINASTGGTPGGSDKDVQFNNAGAFGGITPGAAGTVLTSGGAGVTPTFAAAAGGSGGLVLVEQHTASSSASLDFTTGITSTYDSYLIDIQNLVSASNTTLNMALSTNGGSTWNTSSIYNYNYLGFYFGGALNGTANGTIFNFYSANVTLISGGSYNGKLWLYNPLGALGKVVNGFIGMDDGGSGPMQFNWYGTFRLATAVNAFQFKYATGNITSGTIRLYGLSK